MLVHWIWLSTRNHISDRVKVALVRHFRDPETVYFADICSLSQIEGLTAQGKRSLEDKNLHDAQRILSDCRRENLGILTYQDAAYPTRLKNIPDPPLVLYYKGRLPDFDATPAIGVVGTRKATAYGMNTAGKLGYQIARCGGLVVSGMAKGIDAMATRGALTAETQAVGVLGCGADVVYPPANRSLFEDMEQYGCLLSEFIPGTPPYGSNFPRRNRIISGLSCGVLVVEAPEKSGALITANAALDQGRDVFVVPGNIDVDSCVGSNRLLRDGAIAVSSGWDIMSEYESQFPGTVRKMSMDVPRSMNMTAEDTQENTEKCRSKEGQNTGLPENKKHKADKKVIDNCEASPYSDLENKMPLLLPDEQKIVSVLTQEPQPVDDVIARTGIPTARMLAMLTLLQVKGIVKQYPGKRVALK